MDIKPAWVKELRERTGAGVMDCKRALVDAEGNLEQALELLRKSGQAKADKKSSRIAAEGGVFITSAGARHAIVEINSETDFVAKDENFQRFAERVANLIVAKSPADLDALMALTVDGAPLEEVRKSLVAKVGENIAVRRFEVVDSPNNVGSYVHRGRIGVLIELEGGDDALVRDLAMQVAAASPGYIAPDEVPAEALEKEREIFRAQAAGEGKPEHIVEKMVEGRVRKFLDEVTLLGQAFVKDPDKRVRDLLKSHNARVLRFVRYEVGEGIEKEQVDFAQEVMAQAKQTR
ncbi:MAG TPA: translation elongation factor Ts [Gammaproteobacteria bacterium]|nr:translation elongation factor Ts [Gammaproteobacteria bacterium]